MWVKLRGSINVFKAALLFSSTLDVELSRARTLLRITLQ